MTLTARAPAQSGIGLYRTLLDDDWQPESPERQLAAAVLLQAWTDANAAEDTVKYGKGHGMSPGQVVRGARRFLAARSGPWARQRQLFTGALAVDDEAIRLRAVALFGDKDND